MGLEPGPRSQSRSCVPTGPCPVSRSHLPAGSRYRAPSPRLVPGSCSRIPIPCCSRVLFPLPVPTSHPVPHSCVPVGSHSHVMYPYSIPISHSVPQLGPFPPPHSSVPFPPPISVPKLPAPCPQLPTASHITVSPLPGVKVKGKSTPKEQLKGPEVCTDPVKLANYAVGVNYLKDSPEVALKPDSEYPEWYVGLTQSAASRLGVPRVGEMRPSKLSSNCSSSVIPGAALRLPHRSLTCSVCP